MTIIDRTEQWRQNHEQQWWSEANPKAKHYSAQIVFMISACGQWNADRMPGIRSQIERMDQAA